MKRIICTLLLLSCALSLLCACNDFSATHPQENSGEPSVFEEPSSMTEQLKKLKFYFDKSEYQTVDSMEELTEATLYVVEKYRADESVGKEGEVLYMTVWFAANIEQDEGYREILDNRSSYENADGSSSYKSTLNSYVKAYYEQIVNENLPAISALGYADVTHLGYTSCVAIDLPAEQLKTEDLCKLIANENVTGVCLSEKPVAEDE